MPMLATIKALFRGRRSTVFKIQNFNPINDSRKLIERQNKALQELKEAGKYGPDAPIHSLTEVKHGPDRDSQTQ